METTTTLQLSQRTNRSNFLELKFYLIVSVLKHHFYFKTNIYYIDMYLYVTNIYTCVCDLYYGVEFIVNVNI